MANIQPTVDALDQPTVMLQIRKIAGTVDSNLEAVNDEMVNIQEQIDQMEDVSGRVNALEDDMQTAHQDITAIQQKDAEQDTAISQNESAIEAETTARENADITGTSLSVVSGTIQLLLNRTLGNINANVTAPFIKTMELIPTATERAFKIRVTFWDDTQHDTNDFVIPAGGGTDVSVTGVTIQDGTAPNSFQVQIELSDGTPISSNDYPFPKAVDNPYPTSVTLGLSGTTLSVSIGLSNSSSVSNTVNLAPLLTGYATQAWVNSQLANYATDTEINYIQQQITSIEPTVTVNDTADPPTISVAVNGKSSTANLPSVGSNEWEPITSVEEFKTLKVGDIVRVKIRPAYPSFSPPASWTSEIIEPSSYTVAKDSCFPVVETTITSLNNINNIGIGFITNFQANKYVMFQYIESLASIQYADRNPNEIVVVRISMFNGNGSTIMNYTPNFNDGSIVEMTVKRA